MWPNVHAIYANQRSNNIFAAESRARTAVAPLPGGEASAFYVLQMGKPLQEADLSSRLAGALKPDRFNVMNRNPHLIYGRQSLLFQTLAETSQHISRNYPLGKLSYPKLAL